MVMLVFVVVVVHVVGVAVGWAGVMLAAGVVAHLNIALVGVEGGWVGGALVELRVGWVWFRPGFELLELGFELFEVGLGQTF